MSTKKNRTEGTSTESTAKPGETQPATQGKSPGRLMFILWGLPLIIFIIIAVIKQCE